MEKINIESFSCQTLFLELTRIRRPLPQFHAPPLRISQGAIRSGQLRFPTEKIRRDVFIRSGWIPGLRQQ